MGLLLQESVPTVMQKPLFQPSPDYIEKMIADTLPVFSRSHGVSVAKNTFLAFCIRRWMAALRSGFTVLTTHSMLLMMLCHRKYLLQFAPTLKKPSERSGSKLIRRRFSCAGDRFKQV